MNTEKPILRVTKPVSVHAPKAFKASGEDFGFFLAGLIDASGNYGLSGTLVISLRPQDVSLAYTIKQCIGYGKLRSKNGCLIYECSKSAGLDLINAVTRDKHVRYHPYADPVRQGFATNVATNNHWLAGFTQGCGQFNIDLGKSLEQTKVSLNYKSVESQEHIKTIIHRNFNKIQLNHTPTMIAYFDQYQLMSGSLTCYWIWRKAYLRLQNTTEKGYEELIGFKKRLHTLKHRKLNLEKISAKL